MKVHTGVARAGSESVLGIERWRRALVRHLLDGKLAVREIKGDGGDSDRGQV